MVEIVRVRARSWWAVFAATVSLVFAIGVVAARQAIRMVWSHSH